jgi:predicted ATPase
LGGTVRAQQASEGALLFLAFLALTHLPAPHRPKLVLLEEPERGVYPKKLEELVLALKGWAQAAGETAPQIVMSTHSPYLASFFDSEEVTFLSRANGGGVRARPSAHPARPPGTPAPRPLALGPWRPFPAFYAPVGRR